MRNVVRFVPGAVAIWGLSVTVAAAGVAVPAPLLGAGLPGLALLGVAGVGYAAVRVYRRHKD